MIRFAKFVAVTAVVITYLRLAHSPWPPPPAGVRLEVQVPSVALSDLTEADAQFHLLAVTNEFGHTKAFLNEGRRLMAWGRQGWPYPLLAETCARNASLLIAFDSAARAPSNHWHYTPTWDEKSPPWICSALCYTELNAYRAIAAEQQGAEDAGDSFRLLSLELSTRLIARGAVSSSQYMVGHIVARTALTELGMVIQDNPPPSSERLRKWMETLPRYEPAPETFTETLRYEYLRTSNCFDNYFSCALRNGFAQLGHWLAGSTPRRVHAHVASIYAHYVDISTRPYEPEAFDRYFRQHVKRNQWRFLYDDPTGALLLGAISSSMDLEQASYLKTVAAIRATRLLCALRLYQLDHDGRWPAELKELAPAYLPSLPADPFSTAGETFGYRTCPRDGFILWSRGPDGLDDGGESSIEAPSKAQDLVYGPAMIRLKREKLAGSGWRRR